MLQQPIICLKLTSLKFFSKYHIPKYVPSEQKLLCFPFGHKPDPGLCSSNEGRLKALFFVFILLVSDVLRKTQSPWSDPVRILRDPGWFAESRTSMERLTSKVWNEKRRLLIININFCFNLPSLEVQRPGSGIWPNNRILTPGLSPSQSPTQVLFYWLCIFPMCDVQSGYGQGLI